MYHQRFGGKLDCCTARVCSCDAVTCAAATASFAEDVVAVVFAVFELVEYVCNDRRVVEEGVYYYYPQL